MLRRDLLDNIHRRFSFDSPHFYYYYFFLFMQQISSYDSYILLPSTYTYY